MTEEDAIVSVIKDIRDEAFELKCKAENMQMKHQFFTVLTILLGVAAPAFVTYNPSGNYYEMWWRLMAIVVTALASASATIRTVLRYGDRYANASLTSMALEELSAELDSKRSEVQRQVKPEFIEVKFAEYISWARKEMYGIKKLYVDKEVAATAKDKIELASAPVIDSNQKIDHTKKVLS
ncbi:DUF4231 domain-containing protein [Undibacterium terreum]|uniref:SMODS and SLOG-associating 2TM effector domain-containing protein n=1 Tax=Undibacterium terreum TaxID=1224302 RepID=A0A916XR54_9BURK|nr:DUF4231 domain-containing protein [Undibacterium terreum]GGC99417.1 hypothetical protein GCM10011396_53650 [Undibacterium terreum]